MKQDSAVVLPECYEPEERLLILASRTEPPAIEPIHELISDGIDWNQVVTTADAHGTVALLYRTLRDHCADRTPTTVLHTLQSRAETIVKKNLTYTHEMLEIVEAAREAGIRVLPYRGPVLAEVGYGGVGHRQFGDIDLLIGPEDMGAIEAILEDRGFEHQFQRPSTDSLTDAQEAAYKTYLRERKFRRSDGLEVELHWQLNPRKFPTALTVDRVWDRRTTISFAGTTIPCFSPEDRMLMLLVHGSRHMWARLGWVVDIVETRQRHQIAWETVWTRSKTHNCTRMVALGLALCTDLFATPIPGALPQDLSDDAVVAQLQRRFRESLFDGVDRDLFGKYRQQMQLLDHRHDQLKFWLWAIATPYPLTLEKIALPKPLISLYRVAHIARLVKLGTEQVARKLSV